jgi:hypothetical protein
LDLIEKWEKFYMPENNGLLPDFMEFDYFSSVPENKCIFIIYFCNKKTIKQFNLLVML